MDIIEAKSMLVLTTILISLFIIVCWAVIWGLPNEGKNKHILYFKYIVRHKWFVLLAGLKVARLRRPRRGNRTPRGRNHGGRGRARPARAWPGEPNHPRGLRRRDRCGL